jgi:hypothetical protein
MAYWYDRLPPWNRIVLTGLVAILIVRAAHGSLTVELMIGTPLVAACLWAFGWAVMTAWKRILKVRIPVWVSISPAYSNSPKPDE